VELGGNTGIVQRITIRTIELRDLEGNLYTIPFSSVDTVKNMSREFAFAQVDVGIAYRENADHVMEVLKHLGAELECDPSFGPNIVGSIEVMGVHELGDSAVTIRCRFKVLPQTQFGVRRAFLGLIKRRFDELGIEIPFPQRTLHWAGPFEQPPFSTGSKTPSDTSPEKA
jgi:small conductance mechanosensitive channel